MGKLTDTLPSGCSNCKHSDFVHHKDKAQWECKKRNSPYAKQDMWWWCVRHITPSKCPLRPKVKLSKCWICDESMPTRPHRKYCHPCGCKIDRGVREANRGLFEKLAKKLRREHRKINNTNKTERKKK